MRKPQFLSPTSIASFYNDTTEFYLKYLCENRPPRIPQTGPMSIGSSFDAYVKSYLYERIFGKVTPQFELTALFETQVEPHNRDKAWVAGKYIFDEYKKSGCLVDLMVDVQAGVSEPRFEFELRGTISGYKEGVTRSIESIPFLGKPDLFYRNKEGASIIHDWKVNGFYSKYNVSPMPGFVRLRDSGVNKGHHKDAMCMMSKGIIINVSEKLENLNEDWATQLSIYSWLCGENIGSDFINSIDQIVCKPDPGKMPTLRFAEHRLKTSSEYQFKIFADAQYVWEVIESGWIFRNMSEEESKKKCELLEQSFATPAESSLEKWFNEVSRGQ